MRTNQVITPTAVVPGYLLLEKLRESYPFCIYRAVRESDNEVVVLKTLSDKFPKKEHIAVLRREYHICKQLQDDGAIKVHELLQYSGGNLALVMEDFGQSLRQFLSKQAQGSFSLEHFFNLSIGIASAIGRIHDKKVIHKNLAASNVLIDPDTDEIRIIDFSSSSELSSEFLDAASMVGLNYGSLPYTSPELTGRINRYVDYRADYYSLGVLMYQMITGRLPFDAADPLEWVHCIISQQATPAQEVNKNIPAALGDIIAKLMAKNAEDRYQSIYGLVADLEQCRTWLSSGKTYFQFELAKADSFRNFQIPQKLYGRERELEQLETYFQNSSNGAVVFSLVAGYSGVGKTAFVNELGRSIVDKRGNLIQGKFEQFKQNAAYATIAHAFRSLIRQLLGETSERLNHWSEQLTHAVGSNGQLLVDLIPELSLIIGEQHHVQELSPAETQNRFQILFINFLKVFASKEHPLVIFLDDLQWSDVPTLHLLSRIATSSDLSHLLVIGTYRDNEVDASHPLSLILRDIEKKRLIDIVALQPLNESAVAHLVKDTLLCDEDHSRELSHILFEKTRGNPFFTIELMKNLKDREVIRFNPAEGRWDYDIARIANVKYSDNVVDLLVSTQNQLPAETQDALQRAACIGATFDLKTLSIIHERSKDVTAFDLNEAMKANMIAPLNNDYKYFGLLNEGAQDTEYGDVGHLNPLYKFQHDRIQQAAYSLIEPQKKQALHLSIGRLLLENSTEKELEERLMSVADQFNEGRSLITDDAERFKLVKLNLNAGIKAKETSAYDAALRYMQIAYELCSATAWINEYELTWKVFNELQQCYYLTGDWENADKLTDQLLLHSHTPVEKGLVLASRTRQYATTGRMKESIGAAYDGLAVLGFDFLPKPTSADVAEEVRLVSVNLGSRTIGDLIEMPVMTDEKATIASQLIMEIFAAAFLSGSGEMFPYLVVKSVNIALVYGSGPESAFAYSAYAMILCGLFNDTALGYEYGKLGVEMIEKYENIALKSRIIYVYTMFVHHWSNHWSTMTPWFRKGIEAGYQSGDLLYLAYSAQDCVIWDPQLDLETASQEQRRMLAIVKECDYKDSLDSGTLFLQMQLNFLGLTKGKFLFSDDTFNEEECLKGMYDRHFMTGISNYHIYKAEIHLMYNDPQGGLVHVLEQDKRMLSVTSLPQSVRFHIVSFLIRSMMLKGLSGSERAEFLGKMEASRAQMSEWAEKCPDNFEHLVKLMDAELAAHNSEMSKALSFYESAIATAHKNSFVRDEAMANEFAARYLIQVGLAKAAEGYLQAAHYLYYRWEAHRKVAEMEAAYPMLATSSKFTRGRVAGNTAGDDNPDGTLLDSEVLDMTSVFKASQAISGELDLEKLLRNTLKILMESAGAQQGYLVELHEDQIVVHVHSGAGHQTVDSVPVDGTAKGRDLPASLITAAIRTKDPVVIGNATKPNPFSADRYIIEKRPLSVMCVPLPVHGRWPFAVYMENNVTDSAFTDERVKIITLLASQASISMENARIYEEQEHLLKAQQRFVPRQFLKRLGHTDISRVKLGESVLMDMSVIFSDIRSFTPLVEGLTPQEVIEMLNQYYSQVEKPISENGGFIDSYAGDGVMALFAVPAQDAVKAGIGMSRALDRYNVIRAEQGKMPIMSGSGINTGPLVLGTMGANDRMQCSVLGDTVNLASRIEQLTRAYSATLLIGEQTFNSLSDPDMFSLRMVDRVAVKGKAKAVKLYEVLDAENDERRTIKESTRDLLSHAMNEYYARRFEVANELFLEGSKLDSSDPVFTLFASRCVTYINNPPPADWGGFEKLNKK